MTTALQSAIVPVVTEDQLNLVKATVAQGATNAEVELYLHDCARQGVHPLDKLIHFTRRGGKYTPITSIDYMRSRAAQTGEYAGNDDPQFRGLAGDLDFRERPGAADIHDVFAATVTVYRIVKGTRCPFTATARWAEYFPGERQGAMWKRMPCTMLGKCAEALALRKGFPQQLAGLYASEEMDQAGPSNGAPPRAVEDAPPATVNAQSAAAVPATPPGTVRLTVVQEREVKTGPKKGDPYWAVTDHAGKFYFIFGDREEVARTASLVAESGEPVLLETERTKQDKASIVAIHRRPEDDGGGTQDIDAAIPF